MKHIKLRDLDVSRIGLGTMGMSAAYTGAGSDDAESIRTIHRALDLGVTFIDTAEIYGPFINEELVGRALKGRRDQVVIGTKFGFMSHTGRRGALDSSPDNIRARCRRLAASGSAPTTSTSTTSTASTPNTPIEETVGAMAELVAEGKVRHLGLSEAGPTTIRRATRRAPDHRAAVGVLAVDARPRGRVLDVLRELGIGFVPYSPLGHGFLTGAIRSLDELDDSDWRKTNPRFMGENFQTNLRIVDEVEAIAARGRRHTGAGRDRMAARPRRRHRPDPRHQARRPSRGERRRRPASSSAAEQIERLDNLTPPAGEHHNEAQMQMIDRS